MPAKQDTLNEILKGCKGSWVKMSDVRQWLLDNLVDNMNRETRITLNIWSTPGVGKTSLVKSLEKYPITWNNKNWDGFKVVDIPLAQIEEMGDVLGFPVEEIKMTSSKPKKELWIKAVDSLIKEYLLKGWTTEGEQRTIYAPPAWVPKEDRPGILLFDDGNRASQRIMKGLMQLVQDYRTISWSIPKGWTIVFTGNPDNRMNQVTDMDSAQLTRMKHITLLPDVKEWAEWAYTQKDLDIRLVQWAVKNPELFTPPKAERTNPRSLTEFARALKRFPKLTEEEQYNRCLIEGNASLDKEVVESIMLFLTQCVDSPIELDEILNTPQEAVNRIHKWMTCRNPRIDVITITLDRLRAVLSDVTYPLTQTQIGNVQTFLKSQDLPKDQVMNFAVLLNSKNIYLARKLLNCPELLTLAQTGNGQLG